MAFDSQTRNRLARFVADARELITDEFTEKFQSLYGLSPSGEITPLADLRHLDEEQKAIGERLRARLRHLEPDAKDTDRVKPDTIEQLIREQAFTVLNRLAAVRMAEKRGIILESAGRGYESTGFKVYRQVAGNALGDTYHKYRRYLFCLFDELAVDLGTLFDRRSSAGLLFLREPALLKLLELLNAPDLESLWAEDETIGWIYQYYNDPAERKKMREHRAPRNTRELAVRNQFFTPRYVVEFLTDNTLGRIWYEMTRGQTRLREQCRYLVRRPDEVFLDPLGNKAKEAQEWLQGKEGPLPDLVALAHTVNGYTRAGDAGEASNAWVETCLPRLRGGQVNEFSTQELLDLLFLYCRKDRFCEGTDGALHEQVDLILRTIRERVESSRRTDLSQETLLRQPVFLPPRALKDPREIRMLDPACGSMHFGLYSFDLFEVIYDEAWNIANGPDETLKCSEAFASFLTLVAQYPDKAAFLREVPRLIIEHNIHGIDIDPRCVQIAGLSLWLRAQRAWQLQHLQPAERPRICRSTVVCAEPMPGEETLLNEFVQVQLSDTPEKNLLGQLVRRVFNAMKLAGEAGSLLKIEEEIAEAVKDAKHKWLAGPTLEQGRLFADEIVSPVQKELDLNVTGITDETFWEKAEARIYVALQSYAEQAEHSDGYQRRLFAADAARGFAFVDVCRKRYDVVLMNPPFGEWPERCEKYFQSNFPETVTDLFSMFFERAIHLVNARGKVGAITNRTWFSLPTFEALRTRIFGRYGCNEVSADLGSFVLDAQVETAASIIGRNIPSDRIGLWIRLLKTKAKSDTLFQAIEMVMEGQRHDATFFASQQDFSSLPTTVYGYWMSDNLRRLYRSENSVSVRAAEVKQGTATADDFRFLRLAWEVSPQGIGLGRSWARFAKGGEYRNFYDDIHLLVKWADGGRELAAFPSAYIRNASYCGSPGVTWPLRTTSPFGPRVFPEGCAFGHKGPVAFPKQGVNANVLLAILASRPIKLLLAVRLGAGDHAPGSASKSYEVGLIRDLPFPNLSKEQAQALSVSTARCVELVRSGMIEDDETAAYFVCPALLSADKQVGIRSTVSGLIERREERFLELCCLTSAIDEVVGGALGFGETDRAVMWEELEPPLAAYDAANEPDAKLFEQAYMTKGAISGEALPGGVEAEVDVRVLTRRKQQISVRDEETICRLFEVTPEKFIKTRRRLGLSREQDLTEAVVSLVSYLVGCALGRWDIRYATGNMLPPELPSPFAPLPGCAPGQLQNEQGLPVTRDDVCRLQSAGQWHYPINPAWDGVLVDDPAHLMDLEARVHQVLRVIWNDRWETIERETCEILRVGTLRDYFRRPTGFFADHLKRYSKSRRQAPIYWPLSTASGRYTLWVYYHRLTDQTLHSGLADFLEPKIKSVEWDAQRQKEEGRTQKYGETIEILDELKELRAEIERVIRLPWKPNVNDGVLITASPLWKLFRLSKWQKDLKACWEELEIGGYDWAHLALSIWPDRVKERCKVDRSIAIAHKLEALCTARPPNSKRRHRKERNG